MGESAKGTGDNSTGQDPSADGNSLSELSPDDSQSAPGTTRLPHPASAGGPAEEGTARVRFCATCGAPLVPGPSNFCGHCGARVVPAAQSAPDPGPSDEPLTAVPLASPQDNKLALVAIVVGAFVVLALIAAVVSRPSSKSLSDEERSNLVAYFIGLGDSSIGMAAKEATCTVMFEGFRSYPQGDPDVWWRDIATYAEAESVSPSEVRKVFADLCSPYADTSYQGNAKDAATGE